MISKFLQKFVYLLENYIPVVCKQKLQWAALLTLGLRWGGYGSWGDRRHQCWWQGGSWQWGGGTIRLWCGGDSVTHWCLTTGLHGILGHDTVAWDLGESWTPFQIQKYYFIVLKYKSSAKIDLTLYMKCQLKLYRSISKLMLIH